MENPLHRGGFIHRFAGEAPDPLPTAHEAATYMRTLAAMKEVNVSEVPSDAQLIDVREPEEWAADHAAGAVHIPLGEVPERAGEIDPDRDIYIICKSGGRSARAAQYLEQARGWEAINVAGGTDAWREAGLPMETPEN